MKIYPRFKHPILLILIFITGSLCRAESKFQAVTFSYTNIGQLWARGDTASTYGIDKLSSQNSSFESISIGGIGPANLFENEYSDILIEISLKFERLRSSDGRIELKKTVHHGGSIPIAAEMAFRYPLNDYLDIGLLFYAYSLELMDSDVSQDNKGKEGGLEYGVPIMLLYPINKNTKIGVVARMTSELSFDDKQVIQQQNELLFKFEYWFSKKH